MVSRGLKEYLQIDLLQMHAITAIRSQGRFGRGQGQEYTEAYVVEYWRQGFTKWERWKNTQNKEVRCQKQKCFKLFGNDIYEARCMRLNNYHVNN